VILSLPPLICRCFIKIQDHQVHIPADYSNITFKSIEPAFNGLRGRRMLGEMKSDTVEAEFLEFFLPGLQVKRSITDGLEIKMPASSAKRDAKEAVG
jgi:hypothetical protein